MRESTVPVEVTFIYGLVCTPLLKCERETRHGGNLNSKYLGAIYLAVNLYNQATDVSEYPSDINV